MTLIYSLALLQINLQNCRFKMDEFGDSGAESFESFDDVDSVEVYAVDDIPDMPDGSSYEVFDEGTFDEIETMGDSYDEMPELEDIPDMVEGDYELTELTEVSESFDDAEIVETIPDMPEDDGLDVLEVENETIEETEVLDDNSLDSVLEEGDSIDEAPEEIGLDSQIQETAANYGMDDAPLLDDAEVSELSQLEETVEDEVFESNEEEILGLELDENSGLDELENPEESFSASEFNNLDTSGFNIEQSDSSFETDSIEQIGFDEGEMDSGSEELSNEESFETTESSEYNSLSEYMNAHNYGIDDYAEYSQDPEWQRLHAEEFPDWDIENAQEGLSLSEQNIDEVFDGLDSYDFNGVNLESNPEQLDSILSDFSDSSWESLSIGDKRASMESLAEYVSDTIGLDNPPNIEFYNTPDSGDFGGYSGDTNTLYINEYTLSDANTGEGVRTNYEAADTVAHELWHAYQHQCAKNPTSIRDYQYQYGFDNYIRPEDGFSDYQSQLVESEARAFAEQVQTRLDGLSASSQSAGFVPSEPDGLLD